MLPEGSESDRSESCWELAKTLATDGCEELADWWVGHLRGPICFSQGCVRGCGCRKSAAQHFGAMINSWSSAPHGPQCCLGMPPGFLVSFCACFPWKTFFTNPPFFSSPPAQQMTGQFVLLERESSQRESASASYREISNLPTSSPSLLWQRNTVLHPKPLRSPVA